MIYVKYIKSGLDLKKQHSAVQGGLSPNNAQGQMALMHKNLRSGLKKNKSGVTLMYVHLLLF